MNRLEFSWFLLHFVSDKAKGLISRTCAYQWVRNVRFSEKLACFVFLLPPFKALPFCLLSGGIPANIFQFKVNNTNARERWNMFKINHQDTSFCCLLLWPWTYFISFSSVSIVVFEQVNALWKVRALKSSTPFSTQSIDLENNCIAVYDLYSKLLTLRLFWVDYVFEIARYRQVNPTRC